MEIVLLSRWHSNREHVKMFGFFSAKRRIYLNLPDYPLLQIPEFVTTSP